MMSIDFLRNIFAHSADSVCMNVFILTTVVDLVFTVNLKYHMDYLKNNFHVNLFLFFFLLSVTASLSYSSRLISKMTHMS